jgi:hypothetical protein
VVVVVGMPLERPPLDPSLDDAELGVERVKAAALALRGE